MKLLFVIASLGLGGAERCMAEMIRRIDLKHYDITVLAMMPVESMLQFDPGIRVINGISEFESLNMPMSIFAPKAIKTGDLNRLVWKSIYWLCTKFGKAHHSKYFWKCLSRYIPEMKEDFDVVIGYGQGPASLYAIDKVPHAKKKFLWVNTDLKRAGYDIQYLKRFYLAADTIVAVSEYLKRFIQELYPQKNEQIVCFYDIIDAEGIIKKAIEKTADYDSDGSFRILTVGRMVEAKALHLAIGAAAILKKRDIKFKWYFVGDGTLRRSIEMLADQLKVKDNVRIIGARKNPYPWFAGCDIYVQTSIYEGSCMVINEALLFNKPIISTNFPAVYEKIENGKNGFICEMNAQSIAEKVERLLLDEALRKNMECYIRQNQLKWESNIQQFYDMIDDQGDRTDE